MNFDTLKNYMVPDDVDLVQSFLATIMDSSDDAIIAETPEGIITLWNPASERLFGYTSSKAFGQPISVMLPPNCSGLFLQILQQMQKGERS
jgi:PAS domain S-box-containing protein